MDCKICDLKLIVKQVIDLRDTLCLFDIDDTLTRCGSIGSACFARAFDQLYGIKDLSIDWSTYKHVTDWGLTYQAFKEHLGYRPSPEDLTMVETTYNQLLREAITDGRLVVREVVGASQFLSLLQASGATIKMATGGWSHSARLKLTQAAIKHDPADIYSSDIAWSRDSIMRAAIDKAMEAPLIEKVVYFGDGVWDVRTCRQLSVPMIGLDVTGNKGLKALGVKHVFSDYTDAYGILAAVKHLTELRGRT